VNAAKLALVAALAAAPWTPGALAQAPAQSSGWYLGSGVIPPKSRPEVGAHASPSEPREATDPSYQQFAGYRFTRYWSLDFGYAGGSRPGAGDASSIQSNAWTLAGTGLLPIGRAFALQGRLGLAVPTAEFSLSSATGALSSLAASGTGADPSKYRMNMLWGFGGQYEFSRHLGLRMDYNSRYADEVGYNRARTDLWSINAVVRF